MQTTTQQQLRKVITVNDDGSFNLLINLTGEQFANCEIDSISMWVGQHDEDGCGDLGVNYIASCCDDNAVCVLKDLFYSKQAYNEQLKTHLIAAGFSASAVNNIYGSEQGMQEEGRASYDAYELGDEIRAIMQE